MKLVLFDIDGTILWTDGAGRRSMEAALESVYGLPGDPAYRYDGKTDRQIAREQLRAAGLSDRDIDARLDALLDTYLRNLTDVLASDPLAARLCEGVEVLLDAVEARTDTILGLLTGNVEGGAARKLGAVGIDFTRFRVNAFGSDHEQRPELPRVAQQRARTTLGMEVPGDRIVIIGDTPADIECGRPIGARAIGVATGRYGVDDLAAHAPHAVFSDLRETERVLEAILA
jgi:phosphoglycolate phosphatase-like HAD superfamily hydrolase